ncbi:ABC transporter ATP-binding protein, partial [Xanthomonas citri pv. citri]|nr:ABC transporter ATP-binding protein [Xanthomonas citri pv. citri]
MIDGRDTAGKSTIQVSHMGVARTFQNIRLFGNLTVEENVKVGLHEHIKYNAAAGILRLPSYWKKEKEAHVKALEL